MTKREDFENLAHDIKDSVDDYRRVFPAPNALAPNLDLAVRALNMLGEVYNPTDIPESEVTFDGTNRAEVIEVFKRHDIPFWLNADAFGTDYGYQRDAETNLPLGEPAINAGDIIVAYGRLVTVFRKP